MALLTSDEEAGLGRPADGALLVAGEERRQRRTLGVRRDGEEPVRTGRDGSRCSHAW